MLRWYDKTAVFFWLRLSVSIALIILVIYLIPFRSFISLISSVNLVFLFIGFLLIVIERFFLAYKWNVLLAVKQIQLEFRKIVKLYYISSFIGILSPTSVGTDILRIYSLYRSNSNAVESACSVLVDKIIALSSSIILALISLLLFPMVATDAAILSTILLLVVPIVGLFVFIFNKYIQKFIFNVLEFLRLFTIKNKLTTFLVSLQGYMIHRGLIIYLFFLSLIFQFIRVMSTYVVSLSLNLDVNIVYFFIYIPIIMVITAIPISVAGIGVRESAFIYFFSMAGLSASGALTLSVLLYALVIISTIPGGIIYLIDGFTSRKETSSPQPVTRS
jgi:uncharacterized protein (TIRG00374 family)